jgi:hypothetical protein
MKMVRKMRMWLIREKVRYTTEYILVRLLLRILKRLLHCFPEQDEIVYTFFLFRARQLLISSSLS